MESLSERTCQGIAFDELDTRSVSASDVQSAAERYLPDYQGAYVRLAELGNWLIERVQPDSSVLCRRKIVAGILAGFYFHSRTSTKCPAIAAAAAIAGDTRCVRPL